LQKNKPVSTDEQDLILSAGPLGWSCIDQLKCSGKRWRTGGEVKGKLASHPARSSLPYFEFLSLICCCHNLLSILSRFGLTGKLWWRTSVTTRQTIYVKKESS
jgi:hypothetical protein